MGSIVAVVHARGGSVRVPLKNIRPLCGRPLVAWTIEAALGSKCNRVIVSTDHAGIAEASAGAGADVPFRRPADLAQDVASELVTQHAIRFHEEETGERVDIAVTIQPTTPFLTAADIDACVDLVANSPELNSAFTVGPVNQRPEWMFLRDETGRARKFLEGRLGGDMGISQTLPPLWHPNGGAYATRRDQLFGSDAILIPPYGIHTMSMWASIDIDEEIDFIYAEQIACRFGWDRHGATSSAGAE